MSNDLEDAVAKLGAELGAGYACGDYSYVEIVEEAHRRLTLPSQIEVLAGAMKKVLPPDALKDLIGYCDPLGEFLEFLRQ